MAKQSKKNNTVLIMSVIIALFAFLLYANTINNGYVLDDFSVIKENIVTKKGFDGINEHLNHTYRYGYWNKEDYIYRPLSLVIFATEWEIWPDNPRPAHIINILFYMLTGLIMFQVLKRIFRNYNIVFPFIVTLIFIAHPTHTEVIANIKSLDEILSFLLSFLTILLMFKYIDKKSILSLGLSLITFFFGFLAKEGTIVFLAIIPLILYFFTDEKLKRIAIITAIYLVPTIIYLLIRKSIIGDASADSVSVADNLLMAADTLGERYATAFLILGKYFLLVLAPFTLVSDYSFNQIPITNFGDILVIASIVLYLALAYFAFKLLKKKHIISFSILYFFVGISLYSNIIIIIGSSFADRFIYMASLGFIIGILALVAQFTKFNFEDKSVSLKKFFTSNMLGYFVILVLILFSYKTISRNAEWESDLTLYSADVVKSPNSSHMRYHYGLVVMKELALNAKSEHEKTKYLKEAVKEFEAAIEIYPSFADPYEQLGLAYFRLNDYDKSLKYYLKSLEYNPYKPVTYSNMGMIFFSRGQYDKALEVYLKAVELNPKHIDAQYNLASTYGTIGQFDKAIETFKIVIELNPNHAQAYYFIAITYKNMGKLKEADYYFKMANKLNPDLKPQ